MDMMKLIK